MVRSILAAAVAVSLLTPPAALQSASPSPSPSLDSVLATPLASDFVPYTDFFRPVQGSFELVDYLGVLSPAKPSQTQVTLRRDGFVSGYGRSWLQRGTNHLLLELVVAFGGAAGAKSWLPEARALGQEQDGRYFKRDIAVSGIDQEYGGHFANPDGPAYADAIGFIKGNDYFLIYMYSPADDLADTATTQSRQQYDLAPAYTIPPSQWPENASPKSSNAGAALFSPVAIIASAVFVGVLLVVLIIVLGARLRRRPAPAAMQLSPDGHFWWDGQAWQDASQTVPTGAQRSADGNYWWDGGKWRPAQPTPAAEPAPPPS